ncbi:MAG: lanthionine synthetase C family protein [Candidatus Aminicenantes bacterium]|nr:lanthionine synthetase C family protein [Candidatus Aminicenantes bacterium]
MKWCSLVDEKNAKTYLDKLSEISDILLKNTDKMKENIGVMGGKAGIALFFFYYARLTMEEKHVDFAHRLINEIFDEINNETSIHTLAGGLAGVGWMMEHLVQNDFVEADTDEILEALDPFLHKAMIYDIEKGNYDFLHGAVGCGAYFIARLAKKESEGNLKELVDHMDKIKHTFPDQDNGIAWRSVLDHEKGTEGFNLSLSHGLASIIVFLAKLLEKGIYTEKVSPLLDGAVRYMLAYKLDTAKFQSNFPSWIGVNEDYPLAHSRLAWCYGDLGIGAALWQAAQSAGNKEWEEAALKTLLHSTGRKDVRENAVIDAGLCHGAAGIAHIYNRMYQHTGVASFKESALYWLEETLKLATYEDGYAGFKAWHTEKYGGWIPEAGLLEGVAGIGLMMISMLSDIEAHWDRCLFLS